MPGSSVLHVTTFFALLVVALLSPLAAQAQQSATCRSLAAQLASIETGRGSRNSSVYQKYDRAVQQQQVQITKTERAASRNSCGLLRTRTCRRIKTSLQKMYANMKQLKAARDQAGATGGGIGRADILRAMKRNNCYGQTQRTSIETVPNRRRTLLEQIFGTRTYSNDGGQITNPDIGRNFGTYRTLCVRKCDGYYFPISFSTTQDRFDTDATQCNQICPGADTALYYHPMPSGDAETSVSYLTGDPYEALPNAYRYRKGVDESCSCRFASVKSNFEEIAGTTEEPQTEDEGIRMATPTARIDRALDPDSAQNLAGGLTLERLANITGDNETIASEKSEIRIVGPAFFPVQ